MKKTVFRSLSTARMTLECPVDLIRVPEPSSRDGPPPVDLWNFGDPGWNRLRAVQNGTFRYGGGGMNVYNLHTTIAIKKRAYAKNFWTVIATFSEILDVPYRRRSPV